MRVFLCAIALLLAGCASPPRPSSPAAVAPRTSAEMVVEKQVAAYNAHDVEAMIATFAPDVRFYMHPNELKLSGLDEVRQAYTRLFTKAPKVHVVIQRRIAQGNFVVDDEHVTGLPNVAYEDAIAIYEVRDQHIVAVWFIR